MEEIMPAFPTIKLSFSPPIFSHPPNINPLKNHDPPFFLFLWQHPTTTLPYPSPHPAAHEPSLSLPIMFTTKPKYKIRHISQSTLFFSGKKKKKKKKNRRGLYMEIELVKCECCGLKEDCTQDYISEVKAKFEGKWLCGLCSEAVRDEVNRPAGQKPYCLEDAVKAHMSFCRKFKSNPAVRVADGMRQMLRRRSGDLSASPSASGKYARSASSSQVGDDSFRIY